MGASQSQFKKEELLGSIRSHSSSSVDPCQPGLGVEQDKILNIYYGDVHQYNTEPPVNVDHRENNLKLSLRDKVMEIIDLKEDECVPLQLAKENNAHIEKFGKVVWLEPNDDRTITFHKLHTLFQDCREHSVKLADKTCSSHAAKKAHILKRGNVVGVVGIAGIGKTTLAKCKLKLIMDGASSNELPFVFYVSFRDIDFTEKCTVLQLLTKSMLSEWRHRHECDNALLKRISASSEIYVFADGLDEARGMDLLAEAPTMTLYDKATPDVILKNIFSGHLLPQAKKFLTSRPGAFHDLLPKYKPDFSVEVLGLSEDSQKVLCRRICDNNEEVQKVSVLLESNPDLSSLCFIPMFCRMTVHFLLNNIKSHFHVSTITDMFTFFLDNCVRSEHFKGHLDDLPCLARLALDGFHEKRFLFDGEDLASAGVRHESFEAFTNIKILGNKSIRLKILDGDKRYFFSHLLWQEFFSALQLTFFVGNDEFTRLHAHFHEDQWNSVVKFMFGMQSPLVCEKLKTVLSKSTLVDLSQKRLVLKKFLQDLIVGYAGSAMQDPPPVATHFDLSALEDVLRIGISPTSADLFKLCSWAYELNDTDLTAFIANNLPKKLYLRGTVLPRDVTCFCKILEATAASRAISVGTYNDAVTFTGKGLHTFLQSMLRSSHKLTKLFVKNQTCDIREIISFGDEMDELALSHSFLTSEDIYAIAEFLKCRETSIKYLDLSGTVDIPAEFFSRCMPKIELITLQRCDLSDDVMRELTDVVGKLESPLKWLDLTYNDIGPSSIRCLSRCLHNIQSLTLIGCNITGADVQVLAKRISEMERPYTWLDLSENDIGSDGVAGLLLCIGNIEELWIRDCKLTIADVEALSNAIAQLQQPMKMIDLRKHSFGAAGAIHLSRCVHNIQYLWLSQCSLDAAAIKVLTDSILRLKQPMEFLSLRTNDFGDEGAIALSRCLSLIKLIHMDNCSVTALGVQAVRSANEELGELCKIFGLDDQ